MPAHRKAEMRRRCCCASGGNGCCFTFQVTASHIQYSTLNCTVTNCNLPGAGDCETIKSFSVTNNYTNCQLAALGAQQFVVSTAPAGADANCECYDQRCVYSWTPTSITFTRQLNFTLGCTGSVPQTSGTGNITVSRTQAPPCPLPNFPYCGCCGGPRYSTVKIGYSASINNQTVNGACGTAEYWNYWDGGSKTAWWTTFELTYCWDNQAPCVLTLKSIRGYSASPAPSSGPGIAGDDCDCNGGLGNMVIGTTCAASQTDFCAPFTGAGALLYQLAGEPPMTLNGSTCSCP